MEQGHRKSASTGPGSGIVRDVGFNPPVGAFKSKSIGVKLDKEVYIKFRTLMFEYDLSVQEVLEAVVDSFITDDEKWTTFLKGIARQKMRKKIGDVHAPKVHNPFSEKDVDVLYDLIAEGSDGEDGETDDEDR